MRVSIVNGICKRYDAISESVRGTCQAVQDKLGAEVRLFTYATDFDDLPAMIVSGVADILLDPFFMESDAIIYHFGIYYDLFNAILVGNAGRGRQIVRYHNVTPLAFLPASQRPVIERSMRQRSNIAAADLVWADSTYNRDDLISYGIDPMKITVSPLYLRFYEELERKVRRPPGAVELLFVGRFVRSKGLMDLVEALAAVRPELAAPIMLRLAGNITFSDMEYLAALRARIVELGLDGIVRIEGEVSDNDLRALYAQADIFVMPSYHEGFCVPVLEALQARCVPVAYDAGNLPGLVGRLGILVETGNCAGLGAGIAALVAQFALGRPPSLTLPTGRVEWADYDAAIDRWLGQFTFEAFAERIGRDLAGVGTECELVKQ